jgi:hypothetical protein
MIRWLGCSGSSWSALVTWVDLVTNSRLKVNAKNDNKKDKIYDLKKKYKNFSYG